ncbi:hypothetical protein K530_51420 [Streptomyces noursei CCRC 11814]|nr:hypothetical protein K530_51420 [Streptomyces noursei CCRC 11814]
MWPSREAGDRAHRVQSVLLGIDQVATLAGPALAALLLQWTGAAGMLTAIAGFSLLTTALAPRRLCLVRLWVGLCDWSVVADACPSRSVP